MFGGRASEIQPRRKLASTGRATRVLNHTLKLEKSPLFRETGGVWPRTVSIRQQRQAPISCRKPSLHSQIVLRPSAMWLLPLLSCRASPKLLTKALAT